MTSSYHGSKVSGSPQSFLTETVGSFIRGEKETRLTEDANFPYKRHISSKIRRGLAKTRLVLEQPVTPVLR